LPPENTGPGIDYDRSICKCKWGRSPKKRRTPAQTVLMPSQIKPAFIGCNRGNISQPDLIGSRGCEILSPQIICDRQRVGRVGRGPEFPFLFAAQFKLTAQSFNPVNSYMHPMRSQIFLQTVRTIGFSGSTMGGLALNFKPCIFQRSMRRRTLSPGVLHHDSRSLTIRFSIG